MDRRTDKTERRAFLFLRSFFSLLISSAVSQLDNDGEKRGDENETRGT